MNALVATKSLQSVVKQSLRTQAMRPMSIISKESAEEYKKLVRDPCFCNSRASFKNRKIDTHFVNRFLELLFPSEANGASSEPSRSDLCIPGDGNF